MPNINDYHAFTSTSGGGGGGSSRGGGGPGCNMGCLGWIVAGIAVLCVISNMF